MQTVDTLQGLHAYMNTMMNTNDEVIRFQLKKLPRYWGYREDNFVYYMLTPPWSLAVKQKAVSGRLSRGAGRELGS